MESLRYTSTTQQAIGKEKIDRQEMRKWNPHCGHRAPSSSGRVTLANVVLLRKVPARKVSVTVVSTKVPASGAGESGAGECSVAEEGSGEESVGEGGAGAGQRVRASGRWFCGGGGDGGVGRLEG